MNTSMILVGEDISYLDWPLDLYSDRFEAYDCQLIVREEEPRFREEPLIRECQVRCLVLCQSFSELDQVIAKQWPGSHAKVLSVNRVFQQTRLLLTEQTLRRVPGFRDFLCGMAQSYGLVCGGG